MKNTLIFAATIFLALMAGCAGSSSISKIMTDPISEDSCLIVGGVLAENLGVAHLSEPLMANIEVVIVGKKESDGEVVGYHTWTDDQGYFFIENVPKGAYQIKGFRLLIGNLYDAKISNDWEEPNSHYYILRNTHDEILQVAKWFPRVPDKNKHDLGILYVGLSPIGPTAKLHNHIAFQKYKSIENKELRLGITYNKPAPLDYFKQKFPGSGWFK